MQYHIGMPPPVSPEPLPRAVRVFVSSTFQDMQAEREELVKRVFPALRKRCEQRGVVWGEVDLRWGITDEQKAEGRVLPICLEEIRNCRPYFIGMLGRRYGWVPTAVDPTLIEREPWLAEHRDRSVTELEILHGVLNNPAMARHAFFYFRAGGAADDPRLDDLKERIRRSGFPVREDYPDPAALGALVETDLGAVIDRLFPEGSAPDPLTRERAEHETFAAGRAGVYIGREEYFERLDAGDSPLVVVGDSGSGKSALLANWVRRHREAHPEDVAIQHYIGATGPSSDWTELVRRILGELRQRWPDLEPPPVHSADLRSALASTLERVANRAPVVLVLDALNQLEDRDAALDLAWLPEALPPGIRLLVSTLEGRPLDAVRRRGWAELAVEPLAEAERTDLIARYLAQYRKALSPERAARIAAAPASANPLYLRALLEELRLWGAHDTLDEGIERYLAAPDPEALYLVILTRWEADYERDRPRLVGDAMRALWSARRGLSQAELLDLLGADGAPLPGRFWSPLHLAAESALLNRAGLLGFFHDYLRRAVEHRYLPDADARRAAHLRLADYFAGRDAGPRQVEELPWQLQQAQAWDRLAHTLTEPSLFIPLARDRDYELLGYWLAIGGRAARPEPAHEAVAERLLAEDRHAERTILYLDLLARFHNLAGRFEAAERGFLRLIPLMEEAELGTTDLATAHMNLAELYRMSGRHREALTSGRKAIAMQCGQLGLRGLSIEAALERMAERLADPAEYLTASSSRRRQVEDLAIAAANIAIAHDEQAEFARGAALYERVIRMEELMYGPDDPRLATTLSNLGCAYSELDAMVDPPLAENRSLALFRRALRIKEMRFGRAHPELLEPLSNLGATLESLEPDGPAQAEEYFRRMLAIAESAYGRDHPQYASALGRLAGLHHKRKQYSEAEEVYRQALTVLERTRGPRSDGVGMYLTDLGITLEAAERRLEALGCYARAEAILRETLGPDHLARANALFRLANAYSGQLRAFKAIACYREATRIIQAGGHGMQDSLSAGRNWLYFAVFLWPVLVVLLGPRVLLERIMDGKKPDARTE